MWTTDSAWKAKEVSQETIEGPATGQKYPLMAVVTGQFPDAYKEKPRPAWPPAQPMPGMPPTPPEPEDEEVPAATPAPGKLVLLGCAQMFNKNFLQSGNLDLFLNSVDTVTLGDDIVSVRGRKPIDRAIDKPSDTQRRVWKFVNYACVNIGVAAAGILVAAVRKRSRDAYTMAFAGGEA
jgi:hypothetical protein